MVGWCTWDGMWDGVVEFGKIWNWGGGGGVVVRFWDKMQRKNVVRAFYGKGMRKKGGRDSRLDM